MRTRRARDLERHHQRTLHQNGEEPFTSQTLPMASRQCKGQPTRFNRHICLSSQQSPEREGTLEMVIFNSSRIQVFSPAARFCDRVHRLQVSDPLFKGSNTPMPM